MGRGEDAGGGRKRPTNLAAALEAIVGAAYLDQGYEVARRVVLGFLSDELSDLGERSAPKDPKSALQEAVQGKGIPAPSYRIIDVVGQEHARRFTAEVIVEGRVAGRGTGVRKSQAEQSAATEALKALDSIIR
jgi:ribonuclease-3